MDWEILHKRATGTSGTVDKGFVFAVWSAAYRRANGQPNPSRSPEWDPKPLAPRTLRELVMADPVKLLLQDAELRRLFTAGVQVVQLAC